MTKQSLLRIFPKNLKRCWSWILCRTKSREAGEECKTESNYWNTPNTNTIASSIIIYHTIQIYSSCIFPLSTDSSTSLLQLHPFSVAASQTAESPLRMKLLISIFAILLTQSSGYINNVPRAFRGNHVIKATSTKIDILSREIELTEPLKSRVDAKIGKVNDQIVSSSFISPRKVLS